MCLDLFYEENPCGSILARAASSKQPLYFILLALPNRENVGRDTATAVANYSGRDLNYSYNFEMFSDLFYEENPSGSILTRGHLQ